MQDESVVPCQCGCGGRAPLAKKNDRSTNRVKGQPMRFIRGHSRKAFPEYAVDPATGCWIWQQSHDGIGYGKLRYEGRDRKAHAVYYERYVGPVPVGFEIEHECRNRICVNPAHLRLATRFQNMQNLPVVTGRGTSRFRGVARTRSGRWEAYVGIDGVRYNLGTHEGEEQAAAVVSRFRAAHAPFSPDARGAK